MAPVVAPVCDLKTAEDYSIVPADYKYLFILWIVCRHFLAHFRYARKSRAAFQHAAQLPELLWRPDYKHLDAAIGKISYVAPDFKLGRGALRKVAEPNALHHA
jgi:hypothetical protein